MNENTHITKKRYACFRFNALFIFSIKDLPQTRQLNICHSAVLTSISNVIINSLPASVKPTINLGEKDATCTLYLRKTRSKHRMTAGRTESYYYNTCGKINKGLQFKQKSRYEVSRFPNFISAKIFVCFNNVFKNQPTISSGSSYAVLAGIIQIIWVLLSHSTRQSSASVISRSLK